MCTSFQWAAWAISSGRPHPISTSLGLLGLVRFQTLPSSCGEKEKRAGSRHLRSFQWFSAVNCAWLIQSRALCFFSRKQTSRLLLGRWGQLPTAVEKPRHSDYFCNRLSIHLILAFPPSSPLPEVRGAANHERCTKLSCKSGWFLS